MVLNDDHLNIDKISKKKTYKLVDNFSAAHFYDRFAAFIIDYSIILSPFIWLFLSPFKKQLGLFTLTGENSLNSLVFFNIFIVVSCISFLYNFLFTSVFGATLGQIFFKLRVRSIVLNQQVTVYDSFLRSFIFSISVVFVGIPLLFTFLHKGHRSIHELVSDTYVKSNVRNKQQFIKNVFYFRLAFLSLIISLFVGMIVMTNSYFKLASQSLTVVDDSLCADVTEVVENWPEEREIIPKRLSIAMAMYAIDGMDSDCLSKEAEYVFSTGEESELAYLAKAFVYAGQASRSDLYLDKVCQLSSESEACKMSKVIDGWATDDYEKVSSVLSSLSSETAYVNLWKTRFYMSRGEYKKALEHINLIPKVKMMSRFSAVNKVKLYWYNNDRRLSSAVFDSILEKENPVDSLEISNWLCGEELQNSCVNSGNTSCNYLEQQSKKIDFIGDIGFLQKLDCDDSLDTSVRYAWTDDSRKLIAYLNSQSFGSNNALISFLSDQLFINKNIPLFAIIKHLNFKDKLSNKLISKLVSFTDNLKSNFDKSKVSDKILEALVKKNNYEPAFMYGKRFSEEGSTQFLQNMVVSSFKTDQIEYARYYLKKIELNSIPKLNSLRRIASENDFESIRLILEEPKVKE